MTEPTVAPYGSWKSPITSDLIAAATIRLSQIQVDGDDIYWLEQRPAEAGRNVIVRRAPDGTTRDVNPAPFNARTRVHEYGGGAYVVDQGTVYFSNFADQRLYRQIPDAPPYPLTPTRDLRYAAGVIDRRRGRMIAVREDHTGGGEAVNTLVSLDLEGDEKNGGEVLGSGNDFYASPRISPDGARIAWLTWNHPNMPWDENELWVAELTTAGLLRNAQKVAGAAGESLFQPEWSPDGVLHFVSDRTGWWNLYRWRDGQIEPLHPMEAEFGEPQWVFGQSLYAFDSAQRIVCTYIVKGDCHLATLDTRTGQLESLEIPYTEIESVRAMAGRVTFIGGSPTKPSSVVLLELATGRHEILRRSSDVTVDEGYISLPEMIEYPTENGQTAFGYYYPPKNRDFSGPANEKPPLLVKVHGGPTGATSSVLNLSIQFWTSRGFAVLDVNYGGSTGYGTAYRRRLNGKWGIVDLDDTVNGARYLVARGLVDGKRLAVDGGSAGGYTTLAVLTFRDVFKAGASYFGVSDLEALAKETHKFESRYLDSMIGPYPERRDRYVERSPLYHIERMNTPLLILQGLEDKVVPPNQAEMMFEAVKRKGVPVAYIAYEGEQHGFRQAKHIKRSLDAELYFYSKVFGFPLADAIEPVPIENLPCQKESA